MNQGVIISLNPIQDIQDGEGDKQLRVPVFPL